MPFRGEAPVPGEIWRIPVQGDVAPVAEGVLWANGIGFSPDGTVAYGSDYARSCVLAWDVAADGSLTSPRTFAEMPAGSADGMAVDSEGGVWVATGEAANVVRFTADGSLDRRLDVPAPFVSSLVSEARTCATSSSPQGRQAPPGPLRRCRIATHAGARVASRALSNARHALRFLEYLAPRQAQHVPSRQLEIEVPLPVLLESERVGVEAAAVGLHDQPVLWPMEVHLVGENEAVDHGHWEARLSQQLQEEALELAAGEGRLVGDLGEDAPQRAGAGSPARPLERSIHRRQVEQAQNQGLLERPPQPAFALASRQVDERAREGGAGNALAGGDLVGWKAAGAVHDYARAVACAESGSGDFDAARSGREQAEESSGVAVTQHRARTAGQHRSHVVAHRAAAGHGPPSTPPHALGATASSRVGAGSRPTCPRSDQLPAGDDAVLQCGKPGDRFVQRHGLAGVGLSGFIATSFHHTAGGWRGGRDGTTHRWHGRVAKRPE